MIVLTLGTFDLFHIGHVELLRACRRMAGWDGRVVVGLNLDSFVTRYKHRAPVQDYAIREEALRACRYVDLVVANLGEEDSRPVIDTVRPDVLAIGDDWQHRDYLGQLGVTPEWLAERHLSIEYVPRTTGQSTTAIRERLSVA